MYIFHNKKGTQESGARIHRREKTSWKAQREIDAVDRDGKKTLTDHCHRVETQLQ